MRWKLPALSLVLVSATFVLCSAAPTRPIALVPRPDTSHHWIRMGSSLGVTSGTEARIPPATIRVVRVHREATVKASGRAAPAHVAPTSQPPPPQGGGYSGSVPDLIRSIWGSAADCALRIAYRESRFNPRAYNPSGAAGVMQLMPGWYHGVWGRGWGIGPFDPFSAYANLRAAHIMYEHLGFSPWGGCP